MNYLIQEISIYLLVSFVIGALYGWVIRGVRLKRDLDRQLQENNDTHEKQLTQLQHENQSLREKIEQLEFIPPSGAADDWQDEYSLEVITDIEPSTLKKLAAEKITTTKQLWKACNSEEAVYDLAAKIGVEDFAIQRWVSIADLLRIANIEAEDAILLEATEIYSLQDLATQKPARLAEKLAKTNTRENVLDELPGEEKLARWIEHAQHVVERA
jgi:hypothetical protein